MICEFLQTSITERAFFITYHISKAIHLEKRTDIHLIPDEYEMPQYLHDQYEVI